MLASAAAYGVSPVLMKIALAHGMTPLAVLSFRSAIAAPLLIGALTVTRSLAFPAASRILPLLLIGVTLVPLQPYGYLTGLKYLPVSSAAVLIALAPLHVAWIAWIFLGERLRRVDTVILALVVIGAVLVAGQTPSLGRTQGLGALLTATLASAVYAVAARRILKDVAPVAAFSILLPISTLVFILVSLIIGEWQIPPDTVSLAATAASGLFAGVLGPLLLLHGLRRLPATHVAMLGTFEPVVTVLLGVVVMKDRLSAVQGLGTLVILGGITALHIPQSLWRSLWGRSRSDKTPGGGTAGN